MSRTSPLTAYGIAVTLLFIVTLPFLPLLLLTPFRHRLGERLGRLPVEARRLQRPLWVHAASVGEVLAAEPLVGGLRRLHPQRAILVSTTSLTGRETARQRLGAEAVMLLPVDLPLVVRRVLRSLRPKALIILETELWPGLFSAAAAQGVPIAIVSGRLSARAAKQYAWVRRLFAPALAQVSVFAMQTEADAARMRVIGAPAERVHVVGSLKFARQDLAGAARSRSVPNALAAGRPLLVAASTHAGEEAMVLEACRPLWQEHPQMLLLVAPRRPERFDEVDRLLAESGLRHVRRSRAPGSVDADVQVLLLDTVGELLDALPEATAVFVGGTMVDLGGHNVLEPAVFGKPVAFGPRTENVDAAASALLERAAASRVNGAADLRNEWKRFLERPEEGRTMGERGRTVVADHAAVAERTLELLQPLLGPATAS